MHCPIENPVISGISAEKVNGWLWHDRIRASLRAQSMIPAIPGRHSLAVVNKSKA